MHISIQPERTKDTETGTDRDTDSDMSIDVDILVDVDVEERHMCTYIDNTCTCYGPGTKLSEWEKDRRTEGRGERERQKDRI